MKGKCDRSYKEDNRSQLEGSLSGEYMGGKRLFILLCWRDTYFMFSGVLHKHIYKIQLSASFNSLLTTSRKINPFLHRQTF